jgi:ergothioneine biosynthesis protein EgtB
LREYALAVHEGMRARLAVATKTDGDLYACRLALFHEDMHAEALTYMRQTLDYPPPPGLQLPRPSPPGGEAHVAGGSFLLGSPPGPRFIFDNEKWAHPVDIAPFFIDRRCVSNTAFAEFVAGGGYRDERWWSDEGLAWLRASGRLLPLRWRTAADGSYEYRWFDHWQPLPLDRPVCHVNAFEAEAFCRWAGRRLPSEAEWECAATQGLIDWGGTVWEWMANAFAPYPGFSPDRYRDYSRPWFHTHRSARGGSFATTGRLCDVRYRNFYLPDRNDVFAGFRTCAIR